MIVVFATAAAAAGGGSMSIIGTAFFQSLRDIDGENGMTAAAAGVHSSC